MTPSPYDTLPPPFMILPQPSMPIVPCPFTSSNDPLMTPLPVSLSWMPPFMPPTLLQFTLPDYLPIMLGNMFVGPHQMVPGAFVPFHIAMPSIPMTSGDVSGPSNFLSVVDNNSNKLLAVRTSTYCPFCRRNGETR